MCCVPSQRVCVLCKVNILFFATCRNWQKQHSEFEASNCMLIIIHELRFSSTFLSALLDSE